MSVLMKSLDVERRLAEEIVGALLLQHQQAALDGADRDGRRRCRTWSSATCRAGRRRWPCARRSFRSSSGIFSSAATRKMMLSTPSCVSLSSISRDSSSGPISCTVARMGWPCSPNRSQNTVGNDVLDQSSRPISLARLTRPSFFSPMAEMPERSPLMSAANTGTPAAEKPSAITCSETVLPVPVAPVTRPWRLASLSSQAFGPGAALAEEDLALFQQGFALPHGVLLDQPATRKAPVSAVITWPVALGNATVACPPWG